MVYHIKIKGSLDESWSGWLNGVKISTEVTDSGMLVTTLTGDAADQEALYGILDRIRDLNLELISVNQGSLNR